MKGMMATTLVILGALWLYHATFIPKIMQTRAMSDARQLEANLQVWAEQKVHEGKLREDDVAGIFNDRYGLRLGGEKPNRNFREMIDDISQSSAPPGWPGVVALVVGIGGLVSCIMGRGKNP